MHFQSIVLNILVAATAVQAAATPRAMGCGTPPPTEEHKRISAGLAQKEKMGRSQAMAATTISVDTYFHVVASGKTLDQGWVTDKMLSDQLNVMNAAYAPMNITFNLKSIDRTVNKKWASNGDEYAMKKSLRKGDYKTLNLYFMASLGSYLGYCYFPTTGATSRSSTLIMDGCNIMYTTMPGGSLTNYNLGHTVTHEVGHWFGLYHPFEGNNCTGTGDFVDDTPAEGSAAAGCPIGRDSCPGQLGLDPIHNYMDYTYDSCYEQFTVGQGARMTSSFNYYRANSKK